MSGWVGSVWETKTPPPGPSAIEEATPVTIDTLANTEIEVREQTSVYNTTPDLLVGF